MTGRGVEFPAGAHACSPHAPAGLQIRPTVVAVATAALCALLALTGCRSSQDARKDDAGKDSPAALTEDFSWGSIEFKLKASPAIVYLDRDTVVTLTLTSPSEVEIEFPSLADRLAGFTISGTIDRDPVTVDGETRRVRRLRLTPGVASEYRIAPMAVEYTDRSASPPRKGWYATRPVVFERAAVVEGDVDDEIAEDLKARWIYPPFKTIATWVIVLLVLIAAAVTLWKLWPRLQRAHKLRRMSPKDRALFELRELLSKRLIEQNRPKDFYVELTMIVRRYIERVHKVHAPEQTTEEFLAAVSNDGRFAPEVVARLKTFLEAADLVKFAARQPTAEAVDSSVQTARDYVIGDSEEHAQAAED